MTIDCLLHVHSSFSYDSRMDLADIVRTARRHGYRAVLMSEHNNRMTLEDMAAFVRRCDELSDERLLVIPGLELAFDNNQVHLLAYGVRSYIDSTHAGCTFKSLIDDVRRADGVAVLAHPSHRRGIDRLTPDDCDDLDGIEIWNVKNGNRFVPTAADVRVLQRVRDRGGRPVAFAGVDWHHLVRFSPLVVRLDTPEITPRGVLESLRAGRFVVRGAFARVASTGHIPRSRVAAYELISTAIAGTRRVAYRWQGNLERRGFRTPRVLAAVARRLF
jgi:hypothetical protein